MQTKFKDLEHHQFYEGMIRMTHSQKDTYRQTLFYLLGLTEQTRSHVRDLYDFDENSICLEGLYKGWQTSSTVKLTRLAFNLYNGYTVVIACYFKFHYKSALLSHVCQYLSTNRYKRPYFVTS